MGAEAAVANFEPGNFRFDPAHWAIPSGPNQHTYMIVIQLFKLRECEISLVRMFDVAAQAQMHKTTEQPNRELERVLIRRRTKGRYMYTPNLRLTGGVLASRACLWLSDWTAGIPNTFHILHNRTKYAPNE